MERDRHKQLNEHSKKVQTEKKIAYLDRALRQEVNIGGYGTQKYRIKKGPNKGKVL
jgi:hypothetical protein